MINADEDALFCDLWEVYGVHDYKALPPITVARLFCGLRDNSRCKMILGGVPADINTVLLATIADRTGVLIWQNTKDAAHGTNRPPSLAAVILGEKTASNDDVESFASGAEFERARAEILRGT